MGDGASSASHQPMLLPVVGSGLAQRQEGGPIGDQIAEVAVTTRADLLEDGSPDGRHCRAARLAKRTAFAKDRRTMRAPILTLVMTLSLSSSASAQPPSAEARTVQDAVFSATQVERGRVHYDTTCSRCHGADLTGGGARPLVGEEFLRNWVGLNLDGLFEQLNTMPPSASAAGMLGDQVYLDILSFILESNGFPAGTEDLTTADLSDVRIEGEDGPQAVPDHTLVQVVGCLTQDADGGWLVVDASEPIRTRNPNTTTGDERAQIATVGPGNGSFSLLYAFPSPEPFLGHRVEAKGFLIRGDQDALNVTAVDSLSPSCP